MSFEEFHVEISATGTEKGVYKKEGLLAYASIDREVKAHGTSARIFVPREWLGKKVRVLLLEPLDDTATRTDLKE